MKRFPFPWPMAAPRERGLRFSHLRTILVATTAIAAVLAIGTSLLAVRYQHGMNEASRYNGTFDLEQAAVEVLRLKVALGEGSADAARLRYRILRNRAAVVANGTLSHVPEIGAVAADLSGTLADMAPLMERLPSPALAAEAADRIGRFVAPLLQAASLSHAASGDRVAQNQHQLDIVFAALCAVMFALIALGAVLIALLHRQNRTLGTTARTDALTGIPNRLALNARLAQASGARSLAMFDIDHFKSLNDTLGHAAGDELLRELARRARQVAPDATTVARMGGDEFAVLYEGADAARRARAFCERLLVRVRQPFPLEGRLVTASVTIGLGDHENGAAEASARLVRKADIALYAAKRLGRNRFEAFSPALEHDFVHRERLREDLRMAIQEEAFDLAFQPMVTLDTGRTLGFEALLRWTHPEFGPVSPAEFVPIAEESGQIGRIGEWVLGRACREAARWPDPLFVSVNVSAKQLKDPKLPAKVRRALDAHGLTPARLVVEITESALIDNDATAIDVLNEIRAAGCLVSLDDFGTGYASLSYLRRFSFDKLKIDRSFVAGAFDGRDGVTIFDAICDLAHRLRLRIVAEGIETEAQRRMAAASGCDIGQGYLFSRPLTAEAAARRIAAEGLPDRPIAATLAAQAAESLARVSSSTSKLA